MQEKKQTLKTIQKEKILETIEKMFEFYSEKEKFFKIHFPIQQSLIKNINKTTDITLDLFKLLIQALKDEKDINISLFQHHEKSILSHQAKFKLSNDKDKSQAVKKWEWNKNIAVVLQALSLAHREKIVALKQYHKHLDSCYGQITKEESRYRNDIKSMFKDLNKMFNEMDDHEKQQTKLLTKVVKQSKSKELKDSAYFITEIKKIQGQLMKEINAFVSRNKLILDFVKCVVKNEKQVGKRIKQNLNTYLTKKKQIYRETTEGEKTWGLLAVVQDNIQQSRERYLQKTLISSEMVDVFKTMVPPEKSKVHHMIKYLSLELPAYEEHLNLDKTIRHFSSNMSFKTFEGISLAQGWLLTSHTRAVAYLTFDHHLLLFDIEGIMLKNIHTSSSKINKVNDDNVVFLEEVIKGFFKDSKQEYQLKFDDADRMEEFILFMENHIV